MRYEALKIAKEYAKLCVKENKTKLYDRDWKEIARNVYKDDVKPLHYIRCRRTMNLPEVKKIADNRIIQLLDESGIEENHALKLLKEAENIARDKKDSKDLIKIADMLLELREHKPSKVKITESRTYNNSDLSSIDKTINEAQADKRKITVSTEVTNGSNNEHISND